MGFFTDNGFQIVLDPSRPPDAQLLGDDYGVGDPYANSSAEATTPDTYYTPPAFPNMSPNAPVPFGPGGPFVNTSENQGTPNPILPGGSTASAAGSSNTTDAIAFIRQWQQAHPQASPQAFEELATALKNQFGIDRWNVNGTPSNNEFNIGGQKIKAYSEGGNSWYDPAGLSDDGGGAFGNLASVATSPFTAPSPFSYPDFTPPAPFAPPDPSQVANDPAHQFRLKEGLAAVDRGAAANGTLNTGATPKAETAYAQGLATQDYNDLFQKDYQTYGLNYSNLADVYNTNRNNAASNYLTNYNVATGTWDRNRLAGLDLYGQGQDTLSNLFKLYDRGQTGYGVQTPYVAGA